MRCSYAVLVLVGAVALADDKKDPALAPIAVAKLDRKEPVAFEKDVAPIFANKCQVCHAGNLTEGKLDLGTHAGLMKGGKKGPPIAGFLPRCSIVRKCFGPGYEVFGRAYRVLLHPATLLYAGFEPRR